MRRFASIQTITRYLKVGVLEAIEIRHVIKDTLVLTPEFSGRYCYRYQSVQQRRKGLRHELDLVEYQMEALNEILGLHGVEAIEPAGYERRRGGDWCPRQVLDTKQVLLYCNTGETYQTTILYDICQDRFFIGNWGDWAEKNIVTRREYLNVQ